MSTDSPASNGRRPNGQFDTGNKMSPGNPNAIKVHRYRQALLDAGDVETLQGVFKKMGELALAGDTTAAKIYIEYLCGKPDSVIRLSGEDGGPVLLGQVTLQQSAQELAAWRKQAMGELIASMPSDEMEDSQ